MATVDADMVIYEKDFAVALKYDRAHDNAPHITVKCSGKEAGRIQKIARWGGVSCIEDALLARTLRSVNLGDEIPEALYGDVAEILNSVYVAKRRNPSSEQSKYAKHVLDACRLYNVPVALTYAMMATESDFNPDAVSSAGAQGLMQLMPQTAMEMSVSDPFDPGQNIAGGVRYIRLLANEFDGDMVRVIAGYNAGPAAVHRAGGIPPYAETQEYVRTVLSRYFAYKSSGFEEPED